MSEKNRPTHEVVIKKQEGGFPTRVGVAWYDPTKSNGQGWGRIILDPGVVLSWRD